MNCRAKKAAYIARRLHAMVETWRDEQLTSAYRRALVNAHQDPRHRNPKRYSNAYKVAFFAGVKAGLTGANRPQLLARTRSGMDYGSDRRSRTVLTRR